MNQAPDLPGNVIEKWRVSNNNKSTIERSQELKRLIFAMAGACLLSSCNSEPLSETECRTLIEKEIGYATQSMPRDEASNLRDFMSADLDVKVSSCVSSQKSSRKYYQCMLTAEDAGETRKCIDAENSRK